MPRRPYKPERDARIFAAWQGGSTIASLAVEYGISPNRIYEIIACQRKARKAAAAPT
jgi:Mor family transcriptional regulator